MYRPFTNGTASGVLFLSSLLTLFLICSMGWAPARAATISGTVKDPSGAVIAAARVEISGGNLSEPLALTSDASGKFVTPDLPPGEYLVRVAHDGFEPLVETVTLETSLEVQLTLEIAHVQSAISVTGKVSPFANSDPLYKQLRTIGLGDTFRFDNFTLASDVGTFQFQTGTLTFFDSGRRSRDRCDFSRERAFPPQPCDADQCPRTHAADRSRGSRRGFLRGRFPL